MFVRVCVSVFDGGLNLRFFIFVLYFEYRPFFCSVV